MEKIDEKIEQKDVSLNNSDEQVDVLSEQPVEIVEEKTLAVETEIVEKTPAIEEEIEEKAQPVVEEETEELVEDTEEETEESSFEHMLEESLANIQQLEVGDKVSGEILNITDSYIFVSLGGKRDAYAEKVDYKDKKGNLNYKVGDVLKGYVVKYSETETLIAKSLLAVNMRILEEAFESKVPIRGKVTSLTKGGYNIDISGIRVFCPLSHIDGKLVTDPQQYVSETYDFRIIDFKENGRNIVVSRRVILDEEKDQIKLETLAKLSIGSVVQGVVTRLTSFGAFIDLGGIEGLLHISQFSWTHIDSPSDVLNIGDTIEAKIIKMKGEKVSLSMKALQENPLDKAFEELQAGDIVKCKVLRNLPFGSFVEIRSGVEGLIPISELARGRRVANPSEIISEGDMVEAQILKVDKDKRKISLSLKELQPDPWDNLDKELAVNDIVTGIVENVANFGAFIKIRDGVTGLLPNVKLKAVGDKLDKNNIGQEYKVRIVKIDMAEKRISLEPTNMPESVYEAKDDWNKYKQQKPKKEDIIEDNPFANL
ncbi:MAG: S1 RNA-binding domain-containing protein [Candidatus Cloacimonadales bacterium]|nr:S1 RNA-binding domain-containing protein [Candidatus Cloacimonadales bacterium]